MIIVIDYGMGNVGSVLNMLKKVGAEASSSSDPRTIAQAQKLILPGVGAFDQGISNIDAHHLKDVLTRRVLEEKAPFLGICLGAQLLARTSEEGILPGLGWIDAKVIRFRFPYSLGGLKVPHMGWNNIIFKQENPLLQDLDDEPRFYFVHSYYIDCNNRKNIVATSLHGLEFAAVINQDNIWGTQFHPEKSHKFGMRVLKNFVERC